MNASHPILIYVHNVNLIGDDIRKTDIHSFVLRGMRK